MSKTLKHKANYFVNKLLPENDIYASVRGKMKYTKDDIPNDIKHLVEHNTSERYGCKRKLEAKMKVDERKIKRAKERNEFINDLKVIDY